MKLQAKDIKIDSKTLGPKGEKDDFVLAEIAPYYNYVNEKRGDLVGYKYTILLMSNHFKEVDVKIPGKQLLFESDIDQMVVLEGAELSVYVMNGRLGLSCKATDIRLADNSDGKQNFKVKSS